MDTLRRVLDGVKSTLSCGIVDINGDHWDDIVRLNRGLELEVNLFSSNERIAKRVYFGNAMDSESWSISVGNIDNKGPNEIMVAGIHTGAHIFELIGEDLTKIQVAEGNFYSQASNFTDINSDGWLDLFICDDEGMNDVFVNNAEGFLIKSDDLIELSTSPASDNSGNYGSEWADVNGDGKLDLYISKCKASVSDPADPRRINMLFLQKADGSFAESAASLGLDIARQSWVSSFGDLDNDGDLDAFVLNHGEPHDLMENQNNQVFQSRNTDINFLEGLDIHCVMRDFDNNGYLDILISGTNHVILFNFGNFEFDIARNPLPYYNPTSFSVGDLDRNGFLDIYASYASGFTHPGYVEDILWMNQGNDYSFVAFSLRGTISNFNGIGARLCLYGPWGVQTRELKSGESYGIMNSLNVHFGLGEYSVIDSLVVQWPSGQRDVHAQIESDRYYLVGEGNGISPFYDLDYDRASFCEGESISISAGDSHEKYNWTTGETTKNISISGPGIIHLEAMDKTGKIIPYNPVNIAKNPEEFLEIGSTPSKLLCSGGSTTLFTGKPSGTIWSTGLSKPEIIVSEPGLYFATWTGTCRSYSDSIQVQVLNPEDFNVIHDTVPQGEDAILQVAGELVDWFDSPDSQNKFHTGPSLSIPNLQESQTYYVENRIIHQFPTGRIGESEHAGESEYSSNLLNGYMIFNVLEDIVLESVNISTDKEGNRKMQLRDQNGSVLKEKMIPLQNGWQQVNLNWIIPKGDMYALGTSSQTNLEELGHSSPRLIRSDETVQFPYTNNSLHLMNSSFGPRYYLYFYDWQFRPADLVCRSDRTEIHAEIDPISSLDHTEWQSIKVFPNPVSHILYIQSDKDIEFSARMLNASGIEIWNAKYPNTATPNHIDMESFQPGIYFLLVQDTKATTRVWKRVIKID